MKVRPSLIILALALFPLKAEAYVASTYIDSVCMNNCMLGGGTLSQYCAAQCQAVQGAPAQPTSDYLLNLRRAQNLKEQQERLESDKIQLQQQKFQCISACNAAGGNSGEYCEMSCQ